MSMNVWRLMIIRLTGSPTARSAPAGRIGGAIADPADVPALRVALDDALARGEADGLAVAAQEPVGDRVVAVGVGVGHGEEGVVGRRGAGDVGRLAGPVLRARPPRAVAHRQAVDVDLLAVDDDACPVTRPNWSKWWAEPNVEPTAASGSGGITPAKRRRSSQPVAVVVAEVVALRRLDDARSRTPVGSSTSRRSASAGSCSAE